MFAGILSIVLVIATVPTSIHASGNETAQINSTKALNAALINCKSEKDGEELLCSTNKEIVAKALDQENKKDIEIIEQVNRIKNNSDTEEELNSSLAKYNNQSKDIISINSDITYDKNTDIAITKIMVSTSDKTKIICEDIDEPYNNSVADILSGDSFINSITHYYNKGFGERQFTSLNIINRHAYPDEEYQLRMNYKLYSDKTISGTDIKALNYTAGNYASSIETSATDETWCVKSNNRRYVSAHGYFTTRYSILGTWTSTKHYKIYSRVTPKEWYKKSARVEQYSSLFDLD